MKPSETAIIVVILAQAIVKVAKLVEKWRLPFRHLLVNNPPVWRVAPERNADRHSDGAR